MTLPIPPHGGASQALAREVSAAVAQELLAEHAHAPTIALSDADLLVVRRFGDGTLTPLSGPMTKEDHDRVLDEERIIVGGRSFAWGIPLTLPVTEQEKGPLKVGTTAILVDRFGNRLAALRISDIYRWEKPRFIKAIYGTTREDHPGARAVFLDARDWLVGGDLQVFPAARPTDIIGRHVYTAAESRARLTKSGWSAAIACHATGALSRAQEYALVHAVEKQARLGIRAGVVLNPIFGATDNEPFPPTVRMRTFVALKEQRLLGREDAEREVWERAGRSITDCLEVAAIEMKCFHAGPREALMHAIYRQNHGYSHMVVGRRYADAAFENGAQIWGDSEAQKKFENLAGELLIAPINIGFAAYFEELGRVGLIEEHAEKGWKPITASPALLNEKLVAGEMPDTRLMRAETSAALLQGENPSATIADKIQQRPSPRSSDDLRVIGNLKWHDHTVTRDMREHLNHHRGCTVWFTGLSGSGKSTIANEVAAKLHERGVHTYVLDGDNIRMGLNKGLGFSAEERIENIRRIGEVAKLFSDAAIVNLSAFISPFRADRALARSLQPDTFIEVYIKADLATCERRDPKGLYRKARAGEIANFTGIDSPYEEPEKPEVVVDTSQHDIDACAEAVVEYLEANAFIPGFGAAETQVKGA